jgi:ribosomal protein L24E
VVMDDEPRIDGDLLHCSFCGRSQLQVAKLIAGAVTVTYVCEGCVAEARTWPAADGPGRRCGFCGRPPSRVGRLFVRGDGEICGVCLKLCEEIIAEELAG